MAWAIPQPRHQNPTTTQRNGLARGGKPHRKDLLSNSPMPPRTTNKMQEIFSELRRMCRRAPSELQISTRRTILGSPASTSRRPAKRPPRYGFRGTDKKKRAARDGHIHAIANNANPFRFVAHHISRLSVATVNPRRFPSRRLKSNIHGETLRAKSGGRSPRLDVESISTSVRSCSTVRSTYRQSRL